MLIHFHTVEEDEYHLKSMATTCRRIRDGELMLSDTNLEISNVEILTVFVLN